ncbi:hypothetical protein [Flammeovirga sp. SJP92]|uniref:hypothetical protein n=1 Tax=Flammeovirga sp. SJP92 TaxID=1775430 RepID=UPI000796A353|nr:hypothetical protein [Flammeovirga sp. SJP92]KXX70855.1 hypothetical protein AVL50_11480 [Flammeovirga sp. SJP92]
MNKLFYIIIALLLSIQDISAQSTDVIFKNEKDSTFRKYFGKRFNTPVKHCILDEELQDSTYFTVRISFLINEKHEISDFRLENYKKEELKTSLIDFMEGSKELWFVEQPTIIHIPVLMLNATKVYQREFREQYIESAKQETKRRAAQNTDSPYNVFYQDPVVSYMYEIIHCYSQVHKQEQEQKNRKKKKRK